MNRRLLTALGAAVLLIAATLPATAVASRRRPERGSASTARRSARSTRPRPADAGRRQSQRQRHGAAGAAPVAVRSADAQALGRPMSKADKPAIRSQVKRARTP